MNPKTAIITGATAVAAATVLLGASPAAAAQSGGGSQAKSFTIEAVAVPSQAGIVGPDWKACCGVIGPC